MAHFLSKECTLVLTQPARRLVVKEYPTALLPELPNCLVI